MDPREVLGVGPDAGDEELRAAYLRKVREHPPDRSPEEFEKIRDAFETLKDPRRRTRAMLEAEDPFVHLTSLLEGRAARRDFVGPKAWLEALKDMAGALKGK